MTREEAQQFFDTEVMGHYPKWEPASTEIITWVTDLQKLSREAAISGLRKFYGTRSGGYKTPQLGAVIEMGRAYQQRAGEGKDSVQPKPVPLFTLKCVEQPVWGGRVGTTQKFFASSPKKVPGDTSRIRMYAEDMLENFNLLYGGAWKITRDWDTEETPF